ncbi:type II toxin-antitoxin system RelE/ParE family toxin [Bifidobacterium adolescentis]|uniref:type II toxin-antitoxin system RelE family toxin n=1 Tax=Bifidobacterium adolescentis TaxID=1680 RepID=UPI001C37A05A|nr:type II toxin-antitoxin system RelE/ParE family toxin [Bifidobacterium adolescentis]MBV3435338.1 type II toxin-antitoxin system RelE/ParE family toxin [Bifidobacterium adolescentis]
MTWHVEYTSAARKELTANRSGQWRYRIGDYRVLCLLRDEVVTVEVFRIRHRSEAYK